MDDKRAIEAFRVEQYAGLHPGIISTSAPPQQAPSQARQCLPLPALAPDTDRVILHFDADCFYAQCEELRDPNLRSYPLGVTQKFLIVTCNYPARARGVSKLMSIKEAMQRCPELVTINGEDLTPYREASRRMLSVLRRYGTVQKLGLDEIFVDVTESVEKRLKANPISKVEWSGHIHTPGNGQLLQDNKYRPQDLRADLSSAASATSIIRVPAGIDLISEIEERCGKEPWWRRLAIGSVVAREARDAIKAETGLRTSAGIACNKMLAKLVSGLHKPDDQTILMPLYAAEFVAPLPVRALPGIGHKTEAELIKSGITTVNESRLASEMELVKIAGDRPGAFLAMARWGKDHSEVVQQGPPKAVTVEDSFRGCKGLVGATQVLSVLGPDLVARLQEEEEENGRRPTKLTVKWRIKGQGWNRTSASCAFPAVALGQKGEVNIAKSAASAIASVAGQVLAANLKEPFDLTLINIGATGFVEKQGVSIGGRSVADMLRGPQHAQQEGTKTQQRTIQPMNMSKDLGDVNNVSEGDIVAATHTEKQQEDINCLSGPAPTSILMPPPRAAPVVIPKVAAGQSAKRRRDYGGNGDQAPLSKRAERMLRESGPSDPSRNINIDGVLPHSDRFPGSKMRHGPIEMYDDADGDWGADDDSGVLWDDLAVLHSNRNNKKSTTARVTGAVHVLPNTGIASSSVLHYPSTSIARQLEVSVSPDQRVVIHW